MATKKELAKKKAHAEQILATKPETTVRALMNLTGLSQSTAGRVKQSYSHGKLSGTTTTTKPVTSSEIPLVSDEDDGPATLDFEESPIATNAKNPVDAAWGSLKSMLGIKTEGAPKAKPMISAKLDARKQQFVDAATPTLSLALIALATYLWSRIDPIYGELAPDEAVAQRIVEPLCRVYARHASFLTDINPDLADVGASIFALVGYVHVSMKMYTVIKQEREQDDQGNRDRSRFESENGSRDQSSGQSAVRRDYRQDAEAPGRNGGTVGDLSLAHLTDKEQRQHAALSRLAELDYQHRARRAGRAA